MEQEKINTATGLQRQLMNFSELLSRATLAVKLGAQYGGDRDIYQALGYPTTIEFEDYAGRYIRQDMAKAIIDRPVKASWKGELKVIENAKDTETEFEKEWKTLAEEKKIKSLFIRADKLTGLGRYSVILLGLDDVFKNEDFKKPVRKGKRKLNYIKPLSEKSAEINEIEKNTSSPRYGLPKYYNITISKLSNKVEESTSILVHHSRVIHIVEDVLENEIYGTPRLQAVYNRLMDLDKIVGGDAEMFWRGARPGYTGKVDPDYQMTDEAMEDLKSEIKEFENNLRRILVNEGIEYQALEQQLSDPTNHVDVQMQMISAVTGIPKRILVGSERGELSSAQDRTEYISYVTSRREEQNEPMILRPFIDKCIEIGVLPKPEDGYKVVWDKLFNLSDSEKVNMGKVRSIALKEYSVNPYAQELLPFELFLKIFMGLDQAQIEEVLERQGGEIIKERNLTDEESRLLRTRSDRNYRMDSGESYAIDEYSENGKKKKKVRRKVKK